MHTRTIEVPAVGGRSRPRPARPPLANRANATIDAPAGIVEAASMGEHLDFSRFYEAEHKRVYGSMVALCGDGELAADVTADAFARALASWRRVGAMDRPGGWVYQVALNRLRRKLGRSKKERELIETAHHLNGPGKDVDHQRDIGGLDVWAAVRALPERQRHAVVLRYVADLSEPEIADVLGVARGTIASNLADARRSLAAALGTDDLTTPTTRTKPKEVDG